MDRDVLECCVFRYLRGRNLLNASVAYGIRLGKVTFRSQQEDVAYKIAYGLLYWKMLWFVGRVQFFDQSFPPYVLFDVKLYESESHITGMDKFLKISALRFDRISPSGRSIY